MREIWASTGYKNNEEDDTMLDQFIDTLDIIPSMKVQFKDMYKKRSK